MSSAAPSAVWETRNLREVVTKLVDGSHNPPPKQDTGLPMLSARNIDRGQVLFDDYRLISESAFVSENARTRIAAGDVLLTIVGTIGRTAVVPEGSQPFSLQRSVAVLTPAENLLPKFLCYQLQSPAIQKHFEANARGTAQKGVYLKTLGHPTTEYVEYFIRTARDGLDRFASATAQKNINLEVLEGVAIPTPPLAEQRRLVAEVDRRFSLIRGVETEVDANLLRASRLRQSALASAFSTLMNP